MNNTFIKSVVAALLLTAATGSVQASADARGGFQMNMIYNPSPAVLERERKGFVFIYDGFSDQEIESVMDDQFERIDAMMFTRIRHVSADGVIEVEDDGCDD